MSTDLFVFGLSNVVRLKSDETEREGEDDRKAPVVSTDLLPSSESPSTYGPPPLHTVCRYSGIPESYSLEYRMSQTLNRLPYVPHTRLDGHMKA